MLWAVCYDGLKYFISPLKLAVASYIKKEILIIVGILVP